MTSLDVTPPPRPARPLAVARVDWPTVFLTAGVFAAFLATLVFGAAIGPWAMLLAMTLILTQHASLQHEMLHGHPFRDRRWNDALAFLPLGLAFPYERFRALHLAHHFDPRLTDPYEDPESNYLDPTVWATMPPAARRLYRLNNTLSGRMALGPALTTLQFYRGEWRRLRQGDAPVRRAWVKHGLGLLALAGVVAALNTGPLWPYLVAAYLHQSVLRIRTFAEHRAHEAAAGRSVIIEDRGPLALLFLNNNFHAVHHAHPNLPWYELPRAYALRRESFLRRNRGYRYRSYAALFRQHLFRAKDPVPHPLRQARPGSG